MLLHPFNGFPAPLFIVRDDGIKSEFEASFGRVGYGLYPAFEVEPARSLALALALHSPEPL